MSITVIIALIQGLISAAPQIVAVGTELEKFVAGLFKGGVITAAEQNALMAFIQANMLVTKPDWWTVQDNPPQ